MKPEATNPKLGTEKRALYRLPLINTGIWANAMIASGAVAINSPGNNVFTDGTCNPIGSDQVVANAGLGALADNGGPTLTHALPSGSPAIDAANGAVCPATDQRGIVRPQGAGCDVGAFESE